MLKQVYYLYEIYMICKHIVLIIFLNEPKLFLHTVKS